MNDNESTEGQGGENKNEASIGNQQLSDSSTKRNIENKENKSIPIGMPISPSDFDQLKEEARHINNKPVSIGMPVSQEEFDKLKNPDNEGEKDKNKTVDEQGEEDQSE